MAEAEQQKAPQEAAAAELSLLDQIVEEGRFGTEESARKRGRDMISMFVKDVLDESVTYSRDTEAMLNEQIRQIDDLLSAQLNEVMHSEKFKKLESSWRGLRYLVSQTETSKMLKLRVMSITKDELADDLTAGKAEMAVDRSELFRKIHQEEFNVFGGTPYGALLGDYEFDKKGQDVKLLTRISQLAATSHAPFITGTDPNMFGFESFTELSNVYEMESTFEGTEYAQWNAFRESEDSRYVAMTAPRMLIREPYGKDTVPVKAFDFSEDVTGKEHDKYLWANAAWGLGGCVTKAFAQHGWCARIRGVTSGGKVHLRDRSWRHRHEMPDRDAHTGRSGVRARQTRFRTARQREEHGERGVLQRPVGESAEGVRGSYWRCGNSQRDPVVTTTLHVRRLTVRALSENHDARPYRFV
jgi:type VI secretion system protein ImpC